MNKKLWIGLIVAVILAGLAVVLLPKAIAAAYLKKGQAAYRAKDYAAAIPFLQASTKWNSGNAKAWDWLGWAGEQKVLTDMAQGTAFTATELQAQGKLIKDSVDQAFNGGRKNAPLYLMRAYARYYYGERDAAGAINDANEALKLDPNYSLAYYLLGQIKVITEQKPAEALPLLEKALVLKPNDANYMATLAVVYEALGEYSKAESLLKQSLAVNPNFWKSWNNLADVQYKQGKYGDALQSVEKTLAQPDIPRYIGYATRGEIFEAVGRKADAIVDYEKFLSYRDIVLINPEGVNQVRYIENRLANLKAQP